MFKFKDKTYSLEDVQLAAEDSNLSLDDYIVKVGIETDEDNLVKTNGVAETDASVTPEPNMASTSDPGSSVSTKIDNSKDTIIARRKEKALQPSSDPLDYANYDIFSDSFIIPEELEE